MAGDAVQIVRGIYGDPQPGAEIDLAALTQSAEWWEQRRELMSPKVKVTFVVPSSGVKVMGRQEFVGIAGLIEGWRLWLEPWEQFRVALAEIVDAGGGRVLAQGRATGRLRGSGVEMTQDAASLHMVQGGKVAWMRFYLDSAQARRDAGQR